MNELEKQGHDQPCHFCGKPCDNLSASPSKWAVALCHADKPGLVRWHHTGCVSEKLISLEGHMRENVELIETLGDLRIKLAASKSETNITDKHLRIAYNAMRKILAKHDNGMLYDGRISVNGDDLQEIRDITDLELPIKRPTSLLD